MILYWSELVTWGKRELKPARENHGRMNFGWRLLNNQKFLKKENEFLYNYLIEIKNCQQRQRKLKVVKRSEHLKKKWEYLYFVMK